MIWEKTAVKVIQSALCVCLAPLLAAQQVSQRVEQLPSASTPEFVTIPKNTAVELSALELVSSATATVGTPVHFVVVHDVVVEGVIVLRAGTRLTATVTRVKRGVPKHNNGKLEIELQDVEIGKSARLSLSMRPPRLPKRAKVRYGPRTRRKHGWPIVAATFQDALAGVWIAALLPLEIPVFTVLFIGLKNGDRHSVSGIDEFISECSSRTAYVGRAETIRASQLPSPAPLTEASVDWTCPSL